MHLNPHIPTSVWGNLRQVLENNLLRVYLKLIPTKENPVAGTLITTSLSEATCV